MKYALYNNKENKFVKLLATRMLSHETIYELTSDVEEVKELTDNPYTEAELHHFEEVAGVEKGSFENYKLSMQDEEAYTVYNAGDKALQSIHDYLCMLDPRNVDSIADFVDRIQTTIYNLTDFDMEEYFEDKDDPRMHLRLNGFNRPVVFIVEYTFTDNHGPYTHSDVFAYRGDAEDFVRKLKELPSGVSDISVSPRIVYLDKDRTLDNVD